MDEVKTEIKFNPLKICFIADARSPIACNWIEFFIERGHDVHVISTYPHSGETLKGARGYTVPHGFSSLARASNVVSADKTKSNSALKSFASNLVKKLPSNISQSFNFWVTPLELFRQAKKIKTILNEISPDIVHALRIPYEGILAESTPQNIPLLISVWGNDFTLWASRNPVIARQTKRAMQRADALHCDCQRDLDLARNEWGFSKKKLGFVLPGAGGIQTDLFCMAEADSNIREELQISSDAPVVINPRGIRAYVRNDIFFQSIPLVLKENSKTIFICTGMKGNPLAEKWVKDFKIEKNVRLLPSVARNRMAELFRLADITVSPSSHDGTPNTLLEAIACGCFPIAGDIESVREWITNEENGLLCDPTNAESLAAAIVRALNDKELKAKARIINLQLIAERADYKKVMPRAENFYYEIVNSGFEAL